MHSKLLALAGLALPLALPLVAAGPALADCDDPFGKPDQLLDFHIRMSKADWDLLLANTIRNVDDGMGAVDTPACFDKFRKFHAEFKCGNQEWIKIGLRKKKGTERGIEAPNKPPLKLDFNEDFPDDGPQPEARGQYWPKAMGDRGFRKITLNNGQGNRAPVADMLPPFMLPVLLSEHTALRLLNQEIPSSPRTAFARLTMHFDGDQVGKYHGVYLMVEDIDRAAIRRRFGDNARGRLLKASTPDCTPELQYDDLVKDGARLGPNLATTAWEQWLAKNPADFSGTWLEESKKGVDLDVLLRQEAIREILVNGNDTILNSRAFLEKDKWGDGNNWVAWDPEKGVRQYMPWDVDLTFGNQRGACTTPTPSTNPMTVTNMDGTMGLAPATGNRFKCPPDLPILDWCNDPPKVIGPKSFSRLAKAVCEPQVKRRYLEVMCQLTNGPLAADEIIKIWDQADATVREAVRAEKDIPNWEGRDPTDESVLKSYGSEYKRLRDWIPQRIRSVQEQITANGVECKPGCPSGAKESCSYNAGPGQRVCASNRWSACASTKVASADSGGCTFAAGPAGARPGALSAGLVLAALTLLGQRRRRRRSPG